jgi:uncharacterized protein
LTDNRGRDLRWPLVLNDGGMLKKAFRTGTAWIEVHVEDVNALNVFPVPDGDTGTNMLLTCQSACDEVDRGAETIADVMHAIAHGSLMGARGNSGVILSQILRGMARSIDNKPGLTTQDFADALAEGAATAYKGVLKPVEGTILTVVRETAERAATSAADTSDIPSFWDAIVSAANESVQRTPSLLAALRLAGVVDAGGYGLYLLLQGIGRYIRGESILTPAVSKPNLEAIVAPEEGYGYDVQFILHGERLDVAAIRAHIGAVGESTLVVGDEHTVKVHTHVANPGPVIEYGANEGEISHVIIENMQQQFLDRKSAGSAARPTQELLAGQATNVAKMTGIGTVVVAAGPGFEKLLRSLDASAVVPGGQTMNPSTQQILAAIESVPADQVIILPNNKNIVLTAEQACTLTKKSAVVIPTKTIPQGIAALLALNYDADLAHNRSAMEQAAARVCTGEITTAVRDSHMDGVDVQKGEVIGLVDDRLVAAGSELETVVLSTLDKMGAHECELVTLYFGNGVSEDEAAALAGHVRQRFPSLDTEVLEGGQAHYMYIISAE